MYELNNKDLGLIPETIFKDHQKVTKIGNYTEKLTISPTSSQIVSSNGNVINNNGKIIYFDGIISNGTMDPTNKTMWNNIKSMVNLKDKVIVLSMNASLDAINDQREVKVLKDIITKASVNNEIYVVCKGNEEQTYIEDGIRYITYDDYLEMGVSNDTATYKN